MTFRLTAEADEAAFLGADRRLQEEFAYHQPGLLRRTTARGEDGGWMVIDLWRSAADADACAAVRDDDPETRAFMSFVDPGSISRQRYQELS